MLGYVDAGQLETEFKPKLTGTEYMQANCAQCHTEENFAGTPLVARAPDVLEKACYGCHRIEGLCERHARARISPKSARDGRIDYLWGTRSNPRDYSAVSFMPKFDLNGR